MNFGLFDLAGKAAYLKQQLEAAGHIPVSDIREADVFIADCDWRWAHPRPALINAAASIGVKVALYPHGGLPVIFTYDGLTTPDPRVDVRFEHGPGPLEIAALFDKPVPNQRPVGWLFSPTAPFAPVEKPKRILFAPQHPNIEMMLNGTQNGGDPGPALNQPVYKQLLEMPYELVISVVGPPWKSGIYPHPKAEIIPNHDMSFPITYALIQDADIVVAAGSTAAAAVACGKPTVMIGQTDLTDYIDGHYIEATHADQYRDLIRYPLNTEEGDDLDSLIEQACAGNKDVAAWRSQFIGNDGTPKAIRELELLVGAAVPSTSNVTIQGVTARAGAIGG